MKKASKRLLETNLCGVGLSNPTVLASGIWGVSAASLIRVAKEGAGAVTSKSCNLAGTRGYKNPTVLDYGPGLINAVGLANPGVAEEKLELAEVIKRSPAPLIASVFENTPEEFGEVAASIAEIKPHIIEVDLSCPHYSYGRPFAADPVAAKEVAAAVKASAGKIPVFMKLSPNVPDIKTIAKAVVSGGADGITAINTAGPGMVIDVFQKAPVLANKFGGISGPAILPIAVRCVYDIRSVTEVPIIGTGGVSTWADAIQLILAGANAVGIGSAVQYTGPSIFREIADGISAYMKREGYKSLEDFRGLAVEKKC